MFFFFFFLTQAEDSFVFVFPNLKLESDLFIIITMQNFKNLFPPLSFQYYYSIKDISIGGRCVCNGHADTCDRPPEVHGYQLICSCVHNTCGDQCDHCCEGFVQKRWRRARVDYPFVCERKFWW